MGNLIAKIVPLAIGGAVSPILVISVVLLLSGTRKPRARALAFAVGNVVALTLVAVAVLLLFHSVGHTGTGSTKAGKLIDLTLGVLLTAMGLGKLIEFASKKLSRGSKPAEPDSDADHPATGTMMITMAMATTTTRSPLPTFASATSFIAAR